jgi:hypothetical protein
LFVEGASTMIMYIATALVSLLTMLHAYRTGRERYWIMIILFFPFLGVLAYFAMEILPELMGPVAARARVKAAADPANRLKAADKDLDEANTAANHITKADALFDMRNYAEAEQHYRTALALLNFPDEKIGAKLAATLFEKGQADDALVMLESLKSPVAVGEADRHSLLRARILAELGRKEEACQIYADITTRMVGQEARCRYAALLLEMGKRAEARLMFEEVEKGLKRKGHAPSSQEKPMLDWAMAQLKDLRG